LTGLTPIVIKAEEATKLYIMRNSQDHEVQPKDWLHPADSVRITEQHDEHAIQIFTYGSKSEDGVGARVAIFIQSKLAHQSRYTLHNRCSNNEAEQLAIIKALEIIGKLYINDTIPRSATVNTDSRTTLQSFQNTNNHNYLIEEIRKSAIELEKRNWTITFTWIKAHVGIYGNELADKLAKEATRKDNILHRIPKNEVAQQLRDQSIAKWQYQWDHTTKRQATKQFFPVIKDRLSNKIKLTPNFTAIVTAHSETKAYLHRSKIIGSPDCPCNNGNQTVEHFYTNVPTYKGRERNSYATFQIQTSGRCTKVI